MEKNPERFRRGEKDKSLKSFNRDFKQLVAAAQYFQGYFGGA